MRNHRPKRRTFELESLETRTSLTISAFTAAGAPLVLYPANGRYVAVTIAGSVDVRQQNVSPKVRFQVIDEYRAYEPTAPVRTHLVGTSPRRFQFQFVVRIPASVASADKTGRQFYIIVAANDPNGSNGKVIPVLVPNPAQGPPKPKPPTITARRAGVR